MPLLNIACKAFFADYERRYSDWLEYSRQLGELVQGLLRARGAYTHVVSFRPKAPDSLRAKLRKKGYSDPVHQVTDLIGVRVITYYQDDVDRVVEYLRREFTIDEANSVDKRGALDLHEFGYRSVHLIAKLNAARARQPELQHLAGKPFEIQIRSILEHAWSEINHEVIYKGGMEYPEPIKRRFAAIAGTLEMLDGEFLKLRQAREDLILEHVAVFKADRELHVKLDGARLIAFLMVERPDGLGWLAAEKSAEPFPHGIEASCVEGLDASGIRTPRALRPVIRGNTFRALARSFAADKGIAPERVSHLAVVALSIASEKPAILAEHFPEMARDPSLERLVQRQLRRAV